MFSAFRLNAIFIVFLLFIPVVHAHNLSNREMFSRLSSLASGSNAEVKYNLGMFLNNGIGTERDNRAAYRYFTEAAASGHELASYKVGCYLAGQFPGVVELNLPEALQFKLRAAEAGYDLAQLDVGLLYLKLKDSEKGALWLEKASRQGDAQATAYLAHDLTSPSSKNRVKGYAAVLVLKDITRSPSKSVLEWVAKIEAEMTSEQRSEAMAIRESWFTGTTPLTLKARAGIKVVPALIQSLQ
jgi:TPR repeat protein